MASRVPRADAARNRDALLDAATALLREDFDAPLDAIAAQAGLTRRAVYGHFAGREALVDAVIARGAARIAEAVGVRDDADPLASIALLGAQLWDRVWDVRAVARAALATDHAATVAAAFAPVRARLRANLAMAADAGETRDDVALETLAVLVERAALDVLDVADESDPASARRLAMIHPLCAAGVGVRRAREISARVDTP